MDCRISYLSPQGHARELAYSFRRILPSRTPIVDLSQQFSTDGMLHLVGFEYSDISLDTIPVPVQHFLNQLHGKDVLLFATSPVCVDTKIHDKLDRHMLSKIPADNKYHGLYLCQGEVYLTILEDTAKMADQHGNSDAKDLLRQYRKGKGHPNREDIRKGYRFISATIPLENY